MVTGLITYPEEVLDMWAQDTIAAISTPPGEGGIAVVRISGTKSLLIAEGVVRLRNRSLVRLRPWRAYLGWVLSEDGGIIDECLCTYFRGPKSFTGEDVVELSVHGGSFVAGRVLERLLAAGARLAGPGEFTKRAFLNGRLDLVQAEAVIDIIRSTSDVALRHAEQQLHGRLSTAIDDVRGRLLTSLAQIEASIDFPEHDIPHITSAAILAVAEEVEGILLRLVDTVRAGRVARDGLRVVLAGRPNVGKSSLLNYLAGQERAIVTEVAGTTRDTVEVDLNLSGVRVCLVDTAGIRESADQIEKMGIARAEAAIEQADVVLVLLDGTSPLQIEDSQLLQRVQGKRHIRVVTKADQPITLEPMDDVFVVSSLSGVGITELIERLILIAKETIGPENSLLVTNLRHAKALGDALTHVRAAKASLHGGWQLELVAVDIRQAYEQLGVIGGQTVGVDVTEAIFAQFCIGK